MFRASRPFLAATALAVALTASGCTTPAPEPTPTGFASEEEAFAAAEATYRAYVDALNRVDLSDPETFEDVFVYTTGDANSTERESLSEMHANGWTVEGTTVVLNVVRVDSDGSSSALIDVCLDVSSVGLRDANGISQIGSDRPDHQALSVRADAGAASPTGSLISKVTGITGENPCSEL